SDDGAAVDRCIRGVAAQYGSLSIPCYVIMPNHVHMMVVVESCGPGSSGTPTPTNQTIPWLISTVKRLSNRAVGKPLWQRGYYDHIVRDDNDYLEVCSYIDTNPARWAEDPYYFAQES
ncbi:MAG: transposase, partial [Oscillospiraceae bacterium]|nr:transposase [Oscillospiraceae bacterium]